MTFSETFKEAYKFVCNDMNTVDMNAHEFTEGWNQRVFKQLKEKAGSEISLLKEWWLGGAFKLRQFKESISEIGVNRSWGHLMQNGGFVSESDRNMIGTVEWHQILENLESWVRLFYIL